MTKFDELLEFYEKRMTVEGTSEMFDLVDMQQMGITKKDFVSPPIKVPLSHAEKPEMCICQKCGHKFLCTEKINHSSSQ